MSVEKRPRTIIWMGRYIRNKLLLLLLLMNVILYLNGQLSRLYEAFF